MEKVKKIFPAKSRVYSYIKVIGGVTLTLGAVVGGSLAGYQVLMDEGSVLDNQDISETLDSGAAETSVQGEKELNGPSSNSSGDEMVRILENESEQELYQRFGC